MNCYGAWLPIRANVYTLDQKKSPESNRGYLPDADFVNWINARGNVTIDEATQTFFDFMCKRGFRLWYNVRVNSAFTVGVLGLDATTHSYSETNLNAIGTITWTEETLDNLLLGSGLNISLKTAQICSFPLPSELTHLPFTSHPFNYFENSEMKIGGLNSNHVVNYFRVPEDDFLYMTCGVAEGVILKIPYVFDDLDDYNEMLLSIVKAEVSTASDLILANLESATKSIQASIKSQTAVLDTHTAKIDYQQSGITGLSAKVGVLTDNTSLKFVELTNLFTTKHSESEAAINSIADLLVSLTNQAGDQPQDLEAILLELSNKIKLLSTDIIGVKMLCDNLRLNTKDVPLFNNANLAINGINALTGLIGAVSKERG